MIYFILTLRAIHRLQTHLSVTLWSSRLIAYACMDLLIAGLQIAILTVLSAGGLPANCYGLTRQNWNPGDAPNDPSPGYTTIRFGPGVIGQRGELDHLCSLGMASFGLDVLVMLVVADRSLTFSFGLIIYPSRYLLFFSLLFTCQLIIFSCKAGHVVFTPSSLEAHTPPEGECQYAGTAEKMAEVTEIQVELPPRLVQNRPKIGPEPLSLPMSPIIPLSGNPFQICSMSRVSGQPSDQDATLDVGDPCEPPVANGFRRHRSPVIAEKDTKGDS
jgi:hypothetical protein